MAKKCDKKGKKQFEKVESALLRQGNSKSSAIAIATEQVGCSPFKKKKTKK